MCQFTLKVPASILWYEEGSVHFGFVPLGTKINVNARRNLYMSRGLIIRHDNATPHEHDGNKVCCSHFVLNVWTIKPAVVYWFVGLSFVWATEATLKK